MSKLNIDELIHQKLQGMDFKHLPEYWDKMKQELEVSAPAQVPTQSGFASGISSTYFIVGFTTAVAIITFIAFIVFGPFNKKDADIELNEQIIIENNSVPNHDLKVVKKDPCGDMAKNINTPKKENNVSSTPIVSNTKKNSSKKAKVNYKTQIVEEQIIIKPIIEEQNTPEIIITIDEVLPIEEDLIIPIEENPIEIEIDSNELIQQRVVPIKNIEPQNAETNKEYEKDDKLKTVTPMDNPGKKVFKKKGILWYLGFRK